MASFSDLTKLPGASGAPPLPPKTVILYRDDNWNSQSWTISLDDWLPGRRHNVVDSMWDQATYVAFNLPPGTVVTLTDNVVPLEAGQNVADLKGCGVSVDLVGAGQTEAVDLRGVSMNDCVSSFFWRAVDLDFGGIELFEHADFKGNRVVLFLSDWSPGAVYSIGPWWMNERVSSVRWKTLTDRQTAQLFEHDNGAGNTFNNILGYGSTKECRDLQEYRLNDQMSSFRWDGIVPKKEIVAPFDVKIPANKIQTGFTEEFRARNDANIDTPPQETTFSKKLGKSRSVSTTDKFVTGLKTTHGYSPPSATGGYVGSVEVSFSYERSNTVTRTNTEEVVVQKKMSIIVPKKKRIEARLAYFAAELPPTEFTTTAERWYDRPVTGATQDAANNNWYKRVEPVRLTVEGTMATTGDLDIKEFSL
jgi:hypothetical protein